MAKKEQKLAPDSASSTGIASKAPPSRNPAKTNLLIADIILGAASSLLHQNVGENIEESSKAKRSAPKGNTAAKPDYSSMDGRAIITSLGLYGAGKLANRSLPGLAMVVGGFAIKALYEKGKARQIRLQEERQTDELAASNSAEDETGP